MRGDVVFLCLRKAHGWLGEIIFLELAQSYIETGKGFNSIETGRSVDSIKKFDTTEKWKQFQVSALPTVTLTQMLKSSALLSAAPNKRSLKTTVELRKRSSGLI
jgi:hypothetical protein